MASVLVPIAPGFEELEAVTIIDLLVRAGTEVTSAGLVDGPIKASRGVTLIPDCTLDEALNNDYDMVVLPGGLPGADHLTSDPRIQKLLKTMHNQGRYTAAVCAAPKALAAAGVLDGHKATSYPGTLESLQLSQTEIVNNPVVQDGRVITSQGPGTTMAFALTLIEQLAGHETAKQVADGLLYTP